MHIFLILWQSDWSSQVIFWYSDVKSHIRVISAFQPQKLVEEECFKAELVKMMFTEDWEILHVAHQSQSIQDLFTVMKKNLINHNSNKGILNIDKDAEGSSSTVIWNKSATVWVYNPNNDRPL